MSHDAHCPNVGEYLCRRLWNNGTGVTVTMPSGAFQWIAVGGAPQSVGLALVADSSCMACQHQSSPAWEGGGRNVSTLSKSVTAPSTPWYPPVQLGGRQVAPRTMMSKRLWAPAVRSCRVLQSWPGTSLATHARSGHSPSHSAQDCRCNAHAHAMRCTATDEQQGPNKAAEDSGSNASPGSSVYFFLK